MAIDTPHKDFSLTEPDREITRHLRGGTPAMRVAGTIYLPQEPKETERAYKNRVARSYLTNFYLKTSKTFNGKIFRQAPELLDETPESIESIKDDLDNQGNELTVFMSDALDHGIDDGIVHFLIDSPPAPEPIINEEGEEVPRTRGMDMREGRRPYVSIVRASQLIGWQSEVINGKRVLKQIRIKETAFMPDPEDEFNEIEVERICLIEPFLHELWELQTDDNGKEDWVLIETTVTEFPAIPLVTLYTNQVKYMVGKPLFSDLSYLNVDHWQQSSDQQNITHAVRTPILFGTNLVDDGETPEIEIGPNSLVHGRAGAELKYVEHTGKAVEVGMKAIEHLEDRIVAMGSEIVLNKRTGQQQTATAKAIDQAEEDSEMTTISTAIENAASEIFTWLDFAFGNDTVLVSDEEFPAGGINMNKDFSLGMMDLDAVKELQAMRIAGDLSQDSLWAELKRYGVLSEDFDEEAEKDLLETEESDRMDKAVDQEQRMFEAVNPDGEEDEDEDDEDSDSDGDDT